MLVTLNPDLEQFWTKLHQAILLNNCNSNYHGLLFNFYSGLFFFFRASIYSLSFLWTTGLTFLYFFIPQTLTILDCIRVFLINFG